MLPPSISPRFRAVVTQRLAALGVTPCERAIAVTVPLAVVDVAAVFGGDHPVPVGVEPCGLHPFHLALQLAAGSVELHRRGGAGEVHPVREPLDDTAEGERGQFRRLLGGHVVMHFLAEFEADVP